METPTRVVVIDDDEVVLAQMKERFTPLGYDVITTTNPIGCARYLRDGALVLIDYHMPGVDGEFVVQSLRAATKETNIDCTFYLLTSDRDKVAKYKALGFDGAVDKAGTILISQELPTKSAPLLRAR
jgi:CheY-like chemotaxis protein